MTVELNGDILNDRGYGEYVANGYIVDRNFAPYNLGRVLVLGLGKSGKAASTYCARYLGTRVESLTIAAGADNAAAREFAAGLEAQGATVLFETYEFAERYDLCIASPGISQFSDFYQAAQAVCAEVISEVEFAWREADTGDTWVAISGTNGKTTTTALAAHLLQSAGFEAAAVGNIGDTCLGAVAANETSCYVAEVSSYQLASTKRFAPDAAVLLNITPDHLKWHGSFEEYCAAKQKVYANCEGTVVLDATNDVVRGYVRTMHANKPDFVYVPMGTADGITGNMQEKCGSENAAYVTDSGMLRVCLYGETFDLVSVDELQIKGEHNASNALAAAAAALSVGAEVDAVREGLRTFKPLEHRIEPCGSVAGVRCFNDSKATNVDATLKALAAFDPEKPIVLLGGDDKGTDLTELVAQAEKHCKAVVCFGAAHDRFLEEFSASALPHLSAKHLADALETALGAAQAGDIVVLSPACASFDEFSCFEERGDVFKQLVATLGQERGV